MLCAIVLEMVWWLAVLCSIEIFWRAAAAVALALLYYDSTGDVTLDLIYVPLSFILA